LSTWGISDDLFPDQQKFIEDEYEEPDGVDEKDSADEVHEAALIFDEFLLIRK
jgi:hypothetical protein